MKPYPLLCRECRHSAPEDKSEGNLRCHNPRVNAGDAYVLSSPDRTRGTSCISEREKSIFFSACGERGAQWEATDIAMGGKNAS
ncbi:MAG: hypothetical protein DDT20_00939 [Firmicutes bacterium]|nr:hypothetical protein [Bacillota bacterium]